MTNLTPAPEPVVVSESPLNDQLGNALRAFLIALSAYASGKGWIPADIGGAAVGLVMVGVPFVWGQLKTRSTHAKLLAVASDVRVPDEVARVG